MRRIPLATLELWRPLFGEGYWEDCLSRGVVEEEDLVLTVEAYEALRAKYTPPAGLGDRVARILKPIAGAIDALLGSDLKNCGGCAERQARLNELFPAFASHVKEALKG